MKRILPISIVTLLLIFSCKDNSPLTLNEGELFNEVHKNNIGNDWNHLTAGAVILGDMLNKTVPGGWGKLNQ